MAKHTQAGGASTISGVLYQTLWSLLRAIKIHIKGSGLKTRAGEALLILEPVGGGGDLRTATDVEQLKAKSDGGTWSLQTVICDVFPDLFLAVTDRGTAPRFRFVTEGKMGRWPEVYRFFRRLEKLSPPGNILTALDDRRPLQFQTAKRPHGKSPPFFAQRSYTERSLFLLIAATLNSTPRIKKLQLADAKLYKRLWKLLGAFEFVGEQERKKVQYEIDTLLLAVVDRKDQVAQVRDAMALRLLYKASKGNVKITAKEILEEQGLKALPLSKWSSIRRNSRDELDRLLLARRYNNAFDVRTMAGKALAKSWRDSIRMLVIAGESGQGKTWSLASLALNASFDAVPVLWIDASGDAARDLDAAARQFWLDIRGGETEIPLRQVADRLGDFVPAKRGQRLRLCLDNVIDYFEAATIVRGGWPGLGISIAMSCPKEIASALSHEFPDHIQVVYVEDFTWEQLHKLLKLKLGPAWTSIPGDVRTTLRRPLLASLYCDELFDSNWQPTNEYELFSAVWKRLSTGQQASKPLDSAIVESLVDSVPNGEIYPWTFQQLVEKRVDNLTLQRLERCGWLTRTKDDRVQIFHDRLLNWAVAQQLYSSLRMNKRSLEEVAIQVAKMNKADRRLGKVFLGYVPMDLLWLITGDSELCPNAAPILLEALEQSYGHRPEVLYRELAPTIGPRLGPALFARFRDYEGYPWVLRSLAELLAANAGDRVCEYAHALLASTEPRLQRRGLILLKWVSCPELLDQVWNLHIRAMADPTPFLGKHEREFVLRDDSRKALFCLARDAPDWVVNRILKADHAREPIGDLARLVGNLSDGADAWHRSKTALFEKTLKDERYLLAHLIGKFRDTEFVEWLREQAVTDDGFLGPLALQTLSRLEPHEDPETLARAELDKLVMSRAWAFRETWHRHSVACDKILLERAKVGEDPFDVGHVYRNHACDLPAELFRVLLEWLEKKLDVHLSGPDEQKSASIFRELSLLAEAVAPEHIDVLQHKRGSKLEELLARYLRKQGPQRGVWRNGLEREPGLAILRRINGTAISDVVNEFLACDDRYGRLNALEWAIKNPNDQTLQIAVDRSQSDELWNNHPMEQNDSIQLLAAHGQWEAAANGICRWGLETEIVLTDERVVPEKYAARWLDQLREQVNSQPTPGRVMALAFAGNSSDTSSLHAILASNPADGQLTHACIVGLEMLGDETDRGVQLVSRHIDEHRHSVTRMLNEAGTPAAWNALWQDLQKHFDHITALNLMNLSTHADEVLELTKRKLPNQSRFGDWDLLRILILHLRPDLKQRLLKDRWLRDTFHREAVADESNSWLAGSKAGAIECLAEFDPHAAYEAAAQALSTVQWHDRERYPYILFKINSKRAVLLLLDHLDSEISGLVRYAIGRVLSGLSLSTALAPRWKSLSPEVRASACFAASWADDGVQLDGPIRRCLGDRAASVIKAAVGALNRLQQRRIVSRLRDCAASAGDLVLKWSYIDDLIDSMDPGDDFQPWPEALRSVCNGLSPIVLKRVDDRLQKRRKELCDKLKSERYED